MRLDEHEVNGPSTLCMASVFTSLGIGHFGLTRGRSLAQKLDQWSSVLRSCRLPQRSRSVHGN